MTSDRSCPAMPRLPVPVFGIAANGLPCARGIPWRFFPMAKDGKRSKEPSNIWRIAAIEIAEHKEFCWVRNSTQIMKLLQKAHHPHDPGVRTIVALHQPPGWQCQTPNLQTCPNCNSMSVDVCVLANLAWRMEAPTPRPQNNANCWDVHIGFGIQHVRSSVHWAEIPPFQTSYGASGKTSKAKHHSEPLPTFSCLVSQAGLFPFLLWRNKK